MLKGKNLGITNIDSTIVCQAPKLAPHIPAMVENIARAVDCAPERVNVKAKTEEGLGFTGSSDGVKAYAVVMVFEHGDAGDAGRAAREPE
jgi:2-C-methyl-D-erythritol 2,4-cyclodiphosphate synthase